MCLTANVPRGSRGNERSKRLYGPQAEMAQCRSCPLRFDVAKAPRHFPCKSNRYRAISTSYHCNLIDLKINRTKRLVLRRHQQGVGKKARPVGQRALRCHPGKLGKIIAFREMRQDDVSRVAVVVML